MSMLCSTSRTSLNYTARHRPGHSRSGSLMAQELDMFMDKKTIIKRLQKLMLDVKDLETKRFISRTISFIDSQEARKQNVGLEMDEVRRAFEKKGMLLQHQLKSYQSSQTPSFQTIQAPFVVQNCSQAITGNNTSQHENLTITFNPSIAQSLKNQPTNKFLSDTASSQGFFNNSSGASFNYENQQSQIIQETVSQAGTVQCECGLFQILLRMTEKFMQCGLVEVKQGEETLEIDEAWVQEITRQVVDKFQQITKRFGVQLQSYRRELQEKQSQRTLIQNQLTTAQSSVQYFTSLTESLTLQKSSLVQQLQKLQVSCTQKMQKLNHHNSTVDESRDHELKAIKLQLQLKDIEIDKLMTVKQSLQKKKALDYEEIQKFMARKENVQDRSIKVIMDYIIYTMLDPSSQKTACQSSKDLHQPAKNLQAILSNLQLQNSCLKQQCLLLYQKLNSLQLLN